MKAGVFQKNSKLRIDRGSFISFFKMMVEFRRSRCVARCNIRLLSLLALLLLPPQILSSSSWCAKEYEDCEMLGCCPKLDCVTGDVTTKSICLSKSSQILTPPPDKLDWVRDFNRKVSTPTWEDNVHSFVHNNEHKFWKVVERLERDDPEWLQDLSREVNIPKLKHNVHSLVRKCEDKVSKFAAWLQRIHEEKQDDNEL